MPTIAHTEADILPEQILQAALQLYLKHGLKKVTMDDVSRAIGKSRSSLYYYYENRDELFAAVMDMLIRDIIREIAEATERAGKLEEKISAFCRTKIKTSEERRPVLAAMETGMNAEEKSKHQQTMQAAHRQLIRAESVLLKRVLFAAAKQGEIRILKPKELDGLVFVLLGSIRGIRRELAYEPEAGKMHTAVGTLTAMTMRWLSK